MKSVILLFSLVLLSNFNQQANFLISKNQVGDFQENMSLDSAFLVAKNYFEIEKDSIGLEGDYYTVFNIISNSELLLQIEPGYDNPDKVYRYWVYSRKFKTKEGLGIGNTIEDFLQVYELEDFLFGEGSIFLTVKELDFSMRIEQNLIPEKWWSTMDFDELPKNSKVNMMIL